MQWLVDDVQNWWRWASTWASGTGFFILVAWNQMPISVQRQFPDWIEIPVGFGLWGLVMLARIWAQKK